MQSENNKSRYKKGKPPTLSQLANRAERSLHDSLTKHITGRTYVTKKILEEIAKTFFNECCAYCNQKKLLTREHVCTHQSGGDLSLGNVIPACLSCNFDKRDIDWVKYAEGKGSIYIPVIRSLISGYQPLDKAALRKDSNPKIRAAFDRYDAKINKINAQRPSKVV